MVLVPPSTLNLHNCNILHGRWELKLRKMSVFAISKDSPYNGIDGLHHRELYPSFP